MIQVGSYLKVADNCGAKEVQCIRILGGSKKKVAQVGDFIVVAIKKALPRKKVKKGEVRKGVVTSTKKEIRRPDGSFVFFEENTVVLINDQGNPIGTRVVVPIAKELRKKNFMKIISLAKNIY